MQYPDKLFIATRLSQMFHASIDIDNNQVHLCQELTMCNGCHFENTYLKATDNNRQNTLLSGLSTNYTSYIERHHLEMTTTFSPIRDKFTHICWVRMMFAI